MSASVDLTAERVSDLVMANRAIRAPSYRADHDEEVQFTDLDRGLQWGADVVPALLGLFRVDRDPREDHPDCWVGFARHWRGGTLRLDVDRFAPDSTEPVLVVTAVSGRAGTTAIEDDDVGTVELPDQVPTEDEWEARAKRYRAARRTDTADGATAVQAYIAALPGWKRGAAAQFDEVVQRAVPEVRRAVRYHQPFYGVEDRGWFASFSAFSNHVKLSFVCETSLDPEPPSGTAPERQALDLTASDELDEPQVASWLRQAADAPGMNW